MKQPKTRHDVLMLCARASEMLKTAGFEIATVSMKSEAVYFRFPGRHGVLRVAAHKNKEPMIGLDHVVARITFYGREQDGARILTCAESKVESMVHLAIGQYMLKSATPRPSDYRGKRGTWENAEAGAT